MSAVEQLITENLDVWSSAIKKRGSQGRGSSKKIDLYGIKKLRELILELAVRGLLVSQDKNDEPGDELIKLVYQERKKWFDEGLIKKLKSFEPVADEEFDLSSLPSGWGVARLGELFEIIYGKGLSNKELLDDGYQVFGANGIIGRYSSFLYKDPQLLVSCRGAYSGKPNISPQECFVTSNSLVLQNCWENLSLRFFYYALTIADKTKVVTGSAQPQVTTTNLDPFVVLVPPLSEQHRIVAKVDELMALCDQLEQQQENSISAHQTLVETLLAALTNAGEKGEFNQAWARIAEHFDTLFTTEHSIDQLKQTILQLAVMGKLVPQDPNDEPASVLLEKIAAEKERLLKDKKIKKQKQLLQIGEDEKPFELPVGWEWCRFDDIVEIGSGVTKGRKLGGRETVEVPYLRVANVQRSYLVLDEIKHIEIGVDEQEKYQVKNGDLLITEGGDWDKVGRTAIWRDETEYIAHQNHVFKARTLIGEMDEVWLEKYLNSQPSRNYFAGSSKQTTNLASINKTQLRGCLIANPPQAESARIVKKLEELMTLCDGLRTQITESKTTQLHLADVMAEQALPE